MFFQIRMFLIVMTWFIYIPLWGDMSYFRTFEEVRQFETQSTARRRAENFIKSSANREHFWQRQYKLWLSVIEDQSLLYQSIHGWTQVAVMQERFRLWQDWFHFYENLLDPLFKTFHVPQLSDRFHHQIHSKFLKFSNIPTLSTVDKVHELVDIFLLPVFQRSFLQLENFGKDILSKSIVQKMFFYWNDLKEKIINMVDVNGS